MAISFGSLNIAMFCLIFQTEMANIEQIFKIKNKILNTKLNEKSFGRQIVQILP